MLSLAFVVSSLVTLSLVSPAKAFTPRSYTACEVEESAGNATAYENDYSIFSIFALSKDNWNVQTPLALVSDPSTGLNTAWIGTAGGTNSVLSSSFTMNNGWITARSNDSMVGLSNTVAQKNGRLEFTTGEGSPNSTTQQYCIMDTFADDFPLILQVNYDLMDKFSLCGPSDSMTVVYNAVKNNSPYGNCTDVEIIVEIQ